MPIYEYRCPQCGHEQEATLRFSEADTPMSCSGCGKPTVRRISISRAVFPETGRDIVLQTLNGENGRSLPCTPSDRPRMEAAYAKGLDLPRSVRSRGF